MNHAGRFGKERPAAPPPQHKQKGDGKMKRALFYMALAASALLMPAAKAQNSAEPQASDASGPKPSVDELARLKQSQLQLFGWLVPVQQLDHRGGLAG